MTIEKVQWLVYNKDDNGNEVEFYQEDIMKTLFNKLKKAAKATYVIVHKALLKVDKSALC